MYRGLRQPGSQAFGHHAVDAVRGEVPLRSVAHGRINDSRRKYGFNAYSLNSGALCQTIGALVPFVSTVSRHPLDVDAGLLKSFNFGDEFAVRFRALAADDE